MRLVVEHVMHLFRNFIYITSKKKIVILDYR
jgi:hypothetical protein